MQQSLFENKRFPKFIQWDVITFHWYDKEGNYIVMHYWRDRFTAKQWERLKKYAYSIFPKK